MTSGLLFETAKQNKSHMKETPINVVYAITPHYFNTIIQTRKNILQVYFVINTLKNERLNDCSIDGLKI